MEEIVKNPVIELGLLQGWFFVNFIESPIINM